MHQVNQAFNYIQQQWNTKNNDMDYIESGTWKMYKLIQLVVSYFCILDNSCVS